MSGSSGETHRARALPPVLARKYSAPILHEKKNEPCLCSGKLKPLFCTRKWSWVDSKTTTAIRSRETLRARAPTLYFEGIMNLHPLFRTQKYDPTRFCAGKLSLMFCMDRWSQPDSQNLYVVLSLPWVWSRSSHNFYAELDQRLPSDAAPKLRYVAIVLGPNEEKGSVGAVTADENTCIY